MAVVGAGEAVDEEETAKGMTTWIGDAQAVNLFSVGYRRNRCAFVGSIHKLNGILVDQRLILAVRYAIRRSGIKDESAITDAQHCVILVHVVSARFKCNENAFAANNANACSAARRKWKLFLAGKFAQRPSTVVSINVNKLVMTALVNPAL